jgi:hypothetical protein
MLFLCNLRYKERWTILLGMITHRERRTGFAWLTSRRYGRILFGWRAPVPLSVSWAFYLPSSRQTDVSLLRSPSYERLTDRHPRGHPRRAARRRPAHAEWMLSAVAFHLPSSSFASSNLDGPTSPSTSAVHPPARDAISANKQLLSCSG